MRVLNSNWLPSCSMDRVVTHWTAGSHQVSDLDLEHYHFVVDGVGAIHRGRHSIADNVNCNDENYAAHTRGCNTRSIGISACSMAGAIQHPFSPGQFPLKLVQWEQIALAVADLCEAYDIPVSASTVLGHGEVQEVLGIAQRGKWDPMVLPWDRNKTPREVGDAFRARVRSHLSASPAPPVQETRPKVTIVIAGNSYDGVLDDGTSFVQLRPVANFHHWTITDVTEPTAKVRIGTAEHELDFLLENGTGYAETRDVAALLGLPIAWNPATHTVSVG